MSWLRLGLRYTPSPVPLDGVLGVWTAANTRGGLSLSGGQVTLTPDYLVFTPWDVSREAELLAKLMTSGGASQVGDVDKLVKSSGLLKPAVMPLRQLANIELLNGAQWLRPPTARVYLSDGRHFDLGILASPRRLNKAAANEDAIRDWMASTMRALRQARSGPSSAPAG
jgi:hypothetical protein